LRPPGRAWAEMTAGGSRAKIILAYLTVFIVWGSTYLVIRIGVQDLPPALFASVRFLLAGAAALGIALAARKRFPTTRGDWGTLVAIGLLLLFIANGLVVWSEQTVPSGLAALLIATAPLFVAVIDAMLPRGGRLSAVGWAGLFVGLAGVALLVAPGLLGRGIALDPRGVAGLCIASLSWSAGSVLAARRPVNCDFLVAAGIQSLAAAAALGATGLALGEAARFHLTARGAFSIVYLAALGSLLGYSAYVYLLRHVPPPKAATYAYVNPVVAVLLGALVLSEPLDLQVIVAATVILGGVAMVQIARMRAGRRGARVGLGTALLAPTADAAHGEETAPAPGERPAPVAAPAAAPGAAAALGAAAGVSRALRLDRPLAVIDLETTGLDVQRDRIVEIAIVKLHPDGRRERLVRRVNPGVPIPYPATRVHGIRDEDVAAAPPFAELAAEIERLLEGADLAGFNAIRYDLPLLACEFARAGRPAVLEGRAVLDAAFIFHRKEPRHLAAALRFYCGRDLEGAHSAGADAEACLDILEAQVAHYADLPCDAADLGAWCGAARASRVAT